MPLASWLLPTHYRPNRLAECLEHLLAQELPVGWELEILIGHCADDPQHHEDSRIRSYVTRSTRVGGRLTELLFRSRGELVLVTGDDDWQDRSRTQAAIHAHQDGALMTGLSRFKFQNFETGKQCVWKLRQGYDPLIAGACMSYTKELLVSVQGWPDSSRWIDGALRSRIYGKLKSLPWVDAAPDCPGTAFGDGNGNISTGRPFPAPGVSRSYGRYIVTGLPS